MVTDYTEQPSSCTNETTVEDILGTMEFVSNINRVISDKKHPYNQDSRVWEDIAGLFLLLSGACQVRSDELARNMK